MRAAAEQRGQEPSTDREPSTMPHVPQPPGRGKAETGDWQARRERAQRRPRRTRRSSTEKPPGRVGGILRGLSGSLAAGLLVLAAMLVGVQVWAANNDWIGPGMGSVVGHSVAGGVALVAQLVADRRRDTAGGLSVFAVLAVVVGTLWYWWWL
ncbi:hypothetical protein [Haloactinomyces albus]|uniref:Uncharacterized protein n=1 Tax=Haloactinomyces albus TaxID=1352928 RepID=A0AAE3ZDF4_9ACTN|nr:hypothetical protein [Haloactinomyces albus]MDR7302868.1 hypothetical protein [Haloactinomyces albus]